MSKDKMQVVYKSVDELIPYVNNARTHSEKQVTQIAASIKEFGFNNPILLDGTNGVVAGHGRLMAAKKLKIKDVPCIELSHLSETQKKAYILADNKIALNADWDEKLLSSELEELTTAGVNLEIMGFDIPSVAETERLSELSLESITRARNKPKIKLADCLNLDKFKAKIKVVDDADLKPEQKNFENVLSAFYKIDLRTWQILLFQCF